MLMSLYDMSLSDRLYLFPLSRFVQCGATTIGSKQVNMREKWKVIKERSDDMPDNVNNSSTHISVLWKHFLTRPDIHCTVSVDFTCTGTGQFHQMAYFSELPSRFCSLSAG